MYTGDSGACCSGKVVLGGRYGKGSMRGRRRSREREGSGKGRVGECQGESIGKELMKRDTWKDRNH